MANETDGTATTAIQIRVPESRMKQIKKVCAPTGARPAAFTLMALYKVLDSYFPEASSQRKGTKR